MLNDLMVKKQEFLSAVSTELTQRLINESKAMGSTFNSQRFIMNSLEALSQLELINKPISPKQVVNNLMKGAYLNLDFFRKECYLIYYNNKGLQFQTDYKGEVKLVKKHSIKPIFEIYAEVVREGDEYEKIISRGNRTINHRPLRFNNGAIEGAYAHVRYVDGSTDMVDLSIQDIEKIRKTYSKAPNSPAWINRYEEMCKKTVLRLLCKSIQLDFSVEQYKAFQDGGDCEFDKKTKTEEIALNPFDTTNVDEQPTEPQVIDAEVVQTPTTSAETAEKTQPINFVCASCGMEVTAKVANYSLSKFGKTLCYKCQKKG